MNFGADVTSKLPSWVPVYPNGVTKGGFSATSSGDNGDAGTFTFTTTDSPDQIKSFYEGKAKDANMQTESTTAGGFGTVFTMTDSATRHTVTVTIIGNQVTVGYATK